MTTHERRVFVLHEGTQSKNAFAESDDPRLFYCYCIGCGWFIVNAQSHDISRAWAAHKEHKSTLIPSVLIDTNLINSDSEHFQESYGKWLDMGYSRGFAAAQEAIRAPVKRYLCPHLRCQAEIGPGHEKAVHDVSQGNVEMCPHHGCKSPIIRVKGPRFLHYHGGTE